MAGDRSVHGEPAFAGLPPRDDEFVKDRREGTEQGRTKHAWRKPYRFNDVASANAKLQDVFVLSTVAGSW